MEQIDQVEGVQRMQNYIEEHLGEPISLHQLAVAAGYSPWYASRLFKQLLGKTPLAYIRWLRMTKAALKLRDSNTKIIDVALDFAFDSHEGFTRAFSECFGMPPKTYQNQTPPIPLFMPYSIKAQYMLRLKGEKIVSEKKELQPVFVQVVNRPKRKVILMRGIKADNYYDYCTEVGCDVWGVLISVKDALYEPIGMWLPPNFQKPGTSEYAQGVEVSFDYSGIVPEGFELIELPECQMMVFQGPSYDDAVFEEAIMDLWSLMKAYKPEQYGFEWADEMGPRFQLEPQGERGYIEARPVRVLGE